MKKSGSDFKTLPWLIAAIFSLCVILSNAQVPTAAVEGSVKDDGGNLLPGVIVTAKNMETGFSRSAVTRSDGYYRISALPPGKYSLTSELSGFRSETKENIVLYVGQRVAINFELKVATLEKTVTVTSQAPLVQTTKSEIGQVIETQRIGDLPLDGRDFLHSPNLLQAWLPPQVLVEEGQASARSLLGTSLSASTVWT